LVIVVLYQVLGDFNWRTVFSLPGGGEARVTRRLGHQSPANRAD
jgi:hypothetical protein